MKTMEDKITEAIKRGREVTFARSESGRDEINCLLYSRPKGGVDGEGKTAEAALDAALKELAKREGA
jgi:hypothetical protein